MASNTTVNSAVEIAKAVAWPTATIVVALVVAFIVWLILARKGTIDFSVWDKFKLTAKSRDDSAPSLPVVSSEDVVHVPDATAGLPEQDSTRDDVFNAAGNRADSMKFIAPKNAAELDEGFAYIQEHWVPFDRELWESAYLDKKFSLGIGGTEEELIRLADANPTWVVPLAVLVGRRTENHDVEGAEAAYATGRARLPSNHVDWLLRSALQMRYRMQGSRKGLEFVLEWSTSDLNDDLKASLFFRLGEFMKENGDTDGYRVASEIGLSIMPARSDDRFSLGYSYGEDESRWLAALHHYRQLNTNDTEYPMGKNNSGVVLSNLDKQLQIEAFERAIAAGNALASSNLARLLIDEGFISAGERLLAGVEGEGMAAEHLASTRAAALAARRRMEKESDRIRRTVDMQFGLFRSALLQSFRYIKLASAPQRGVFVANDQSARVMIENAGAACIVVSGTLSFEGLLKDQQLCHAGTIKAQGSGGILDFHLRDVILLPVSEDQAKLVVWPRAVTVDAKVEIINLSRSHSQIALGNSILALSSD
jgi:hypothetical protein